MTHLGFVVPFISWVMNYITIVSFSILINGALSNFFKAGRGFRHKCPLSLLLVLIIVEGLCRSLIESKRVGAFKG